MAEENQAPAEATAPETPDDSAQPPAAAGAKKKKIMLFASIGLAVLGLAVAGSFFFLGGKGDNASMEPSKIVANLAFYDVPEFNMNLLSDDPSAQHFVKVKLAVELVKAADAADLEKLMPRLQDDWGGFLRQMRVSDLQGSANLQRLKEGLLRRANQSLDPLQVRAVYIRELLVQ